MGPGLQWSNWWLNTCASVRPLHLMGISQTWAEGEPTGLHVHTPAYTEQKDTSLASWGSLSIGGNLRWFKAREDQDSPSPFFGLSSVQFLSRVRLFATPWTTACQHPCPSPAPRACSNSCPLSCWCHPTISSSVIPFSSHLQSFPVSGSFQMSQFFASGGQSIGVSASASVLPMNIQDWSPLWWTGWISLQSKGLSRVFQHHSSKASILWHSAFFIVQLSHPYMTTGKTIALTRWTFVDKVMSLLFSMLSSSLIHVLIYATTWVNLKNIMLSKRR